MPTCILQRILYRITGKPKEYVVAYLDDERYYRTATIVATDIARAYAIACRRYGTDRILNIRRA